MLRCDSCGNTYDLERDIQLCECGEPLRLEYFTGDVKDVSDIWKRYGDFLPFEGRCDLRLGEGRTPIVKANKLSRQLDIDLHLKNETVNPTWSFKDRGTYLGLVRALRSGKEKISTVSTGNMAASVAAYGARNEMETIVLVSSDIADEKISQIAPYGPTLLEVIGDYGELYYESLGLERDDIYFINSNSPFRIEGYKTISIEIYEELIPDYVMIPTSSGGLFRGITKGFVELQKSGLIDEIPTLVSVQTEGCSPIYRAYKSNEMKVSRWSDPDSIAGAISNPYPPGGNDVLRKLNEHDGFCTSVSDGEILEARDTISREGIYCQPSSAVGIAALKKMREEKKIEKDSKVMSILTGSGLKSVGGKRTENRRKCELDDLEGCIREIYDRD